MILELDHSGHYPNILVEVTEEEYKHILYVQGDKYLMDTPEGRALLKDLKRKPHLKFNSVVAYI